MSSKQVFTGSTLSCLEHKAFQRLTDSVGRQPESLLYLGQPNYPRDDTRERWKEYGPSACLRTDTFEEFVSDCYERDQYKGRVTVIDRPLLFRLVELGVEGTESRDNPFYMGDRFPRAGLVNEAEDLYTNLEFAGLLSADAMRERLIHEGVAGRADHVAELAAEIGSARETILADQLRETYQTERMDHVVMMERSLDDLFPAVDAVIIGGFTRFDVLERQLLERISSTWPTIGLLPKQHDSGRASGVDSAASPALETYDSLDFSREHINISQSESTARRRLVKNLYRHPENTPRIDDIAPHTLDLTYVESETVPDEIRDVARDIRDRLSTETRPEEISVVLTNPTEYSDSVREIFEMYDFQFHLETDLPLPETAVGDVVESICQLSREPRSIDTLLDIFTNPLVSVTTDGVPVDHQHLSRMAARAETNQLETVLDHVDESVASTIDSLVHDASELSHTPLDSLAGRLDAIFTRIGVQAALDGEEELSSQFMARETSARERLERVLETLALTAPVANLEIGDSVDRLERAISNVSIRRSAGSTNQQVVVCSLSEAALREFEHIYVLGMTSSHVPSDPDQMAFTEPIYESHTDFEQRDSSLEARYHFGTLLGSEASIRMSAPQRSLSGEPYVEADLFTELRRFLDLSEITNEADDIAPGCQEDVQKAIGTSYSTTSDERCRALIDTAVDAGTFTTSQQSCIEAGVACATARADTTLTPYDGQLSPEMVAQVHTTAEREPYSASRLETYAACGFKYYMSRVLGIKAPEPLSREPDAGSQGSYIHDVLEHYYLSLQSSDGEPVHPSGDFQERQRELLKTALDRLDEAFGEYPETAFHDEWLTEVLAGLGTPAENEYYGPTDETDDGRPAARGLFYRFLEHEFDEPARTTARPTWFEARVGQPHTGGTPIQGEPAVIETSDGPVEIHGLIDRVETIPGTTPTQAVVRDYKTGSSIPSERDALLGLNFQLPLYALMAEDALDDIETVGAAYYQVSPPTSVSSRKGLLTSQEMATWYGYDDVDVPLLRSSHPHFETHEAFRAFIEETTTRRLGDLVTGVEDGRFHPTVLDPSDAGCRYCDYAHVCDVRSHQRREIIETIDDSQISAYVPPMARDIDPEDIVGVE
jgi:ATP-dependent helicase/nuclease subunit B